MVFAVTIVGQNTVNTTSRNCGSEDTFAFVAAPTARFFAGPDSLANTSKQSSFEGFRDLLTATAFASLATTGPR